MKRTQKPARAGGAWPALATQSPRPATAAGPRRAWPSAPAWSAGPAWPAWPAGQVRIRQAGRADHGALRDFLTGLSVRTRYLRFFGGALPASPAMLRILAGERAGADVLVATQNGAIIGHAMAVDSAGPGDATAEIGVVVADAWQGRGVGSGLVRALAARARARGATSLVMEVMAENQRVLAMIAHRWPSARHDRSAAYLTVHARLDQEGGTASGAVTSSG
jgi:ribosomal protein S18 acetylase RimI-like enzyme